MPSKHRSRKVNGSQKAPTFTSPKGIDKSRRTHNALANRKKTGGFVRSSPRMSPRMGPRLDSKMKLGRSAYRGHVDAKSSCKSKLVYGSKDIKQPTVQVVTRAQQQQVRVFALAHFRQLAQVAQPGSLIVLDIDETMIITRNMPSLLMSTDGVVAFQKYVTKKFPDFATRNHYCKNLQDAIKVKQLVEEDTADVIRTLQNKKCKVFALTARYSELAERTEQVLGSFGISLKESAPFPHYPIRDPVTKAVVMNGVVYCNGEDKGYILSRLLSSVILPRERKEANVRGEDGDKPPYAGIHFVDDRQEHTLSVRDSLQSFPNLNMPSICFHYRSPISLQTETQRTLKMEHPQLLAFMMDHFIEHNDVLSNSQALSLFQSA